MKTKKFLLGLGLALLGSFAQAQGLEGVIVEKYYVSNAADASGTVGVLPAGSVTYRIYADMLAGYKFQALYGELSPSHELKITTTTTFFNNEDRGATTANAIPSLQLKNNSVALDSWFSVGGAAAGQMGVLKPADNGAANLLPISTNPMLKNNDASAGIALSVQDGIISGTPEAVTFVGLTTELDVFDALSQAGSSFSTFNGSIASLNGSLGPDTTNKVLIGQFTTNGVFGFELNIQIGTPTGGTQKYVARNPVAGETMLPSLRLAPNLPPTVSITAPANGANFVTSALVNLTANAADADGTVASVEFFVDGTSVGVDNIAPYAANYTITAGAHNVTARATDDLASQTTSSIVVINGVANPAPVVSITSPANGASYIAPDAVAITANATDDISVTSVEFFVDGTSIGIDNTAPYAASYSPSVAGNHSLTARATDNLGAQTTSAAVSITVANNVAPSVSITAPVSGASGFPGSVTVSANASDVDGTVASVEFFKNGVSLGVDATSPYSVIWTSTTADIGVRSLTARATDDRGLFTNSAAVNYEVLDPSAAYKVETVTEKCLVSNYCVPVKATSTVSAGVTGYDMVVQYNKSKLTPTGVITASSDLLSSSYFVIANYFDTAGTNANINISLYLNTNAPTGSNFTGIGSLFCVGFNKTANFLSNDEAVISVSNLVESTDLTTAVKQVSAGKVVLYRDTTFVGHLQYWNVTNQAIVYSTTGSHLVTNVYGTNTSCVASPAAPVTPNLSGNFTYNIQNGSSISIVRDIPNVGQTAAILGYIGGNDAFLASKVLVNNPTFTPSVYQLIAIDVNRDGKISAGDVSQMSQRSVRNIPQFAQVSSPNRDWLFADAALLATAPYTTGFSKSAVPFIPFCLALPIADYNCPLINLTNYTGIMLGDVDTSYVNGTSDGIYKKLVNPSTDNAVTFDLSKAVIVDGFVNVPVSVLSKDAVNSLDFSLEYNENNMNFQSVVSHSADVNSLVNYVQEDKTLNLTSYSMNNYKINESIVSLRFAVSSAQLDATDLSSITAYVNGKPAKTLVLTGVANSNAANLVSIYPNPANDAINVQVTERSTVQLMDISGQQVIFGTIVNANDKQVISTENIASGVYMMKISNDNFVTVKRVVVSK